MHDLQGKAVKILDGEYKGLAGTVEGYDNDGNALVSVSGVLNEKPVQTTTPVPPLQLERI